MHYRLIPILIVFALAGNLVAEEKPLMHQVRQLVRELAGDSGFSEKDAIKVSTFMLEKLVGPKRENQNLHASVLAARPDEVKVYAAYSNGLTTVGYQFEFHRGDPKKKKRWASFHRLTFIPSE